MRADDAISLVTRLRFNGMFAADWLRQRKEGLHAARWAAIHHRLEREVEGLPEGRVEPVDRVRSITPEQFHERYFLTGVPVVLEGAAADWPAVRRWTPDYLMRYCANDEVDVLDGQHWTVGTTGASVVSTTESRLHVRDLVEAVKNGGAWYGTFLELLDKYADLRGDLDLSFVAKYGHTRPRIPWQRHVLAKMYVGGPGTSTSFHCAGVSNLYVQAYGRKKWVLVQPEYTPFMYPAPQRGINWQSFVDSATPTTRPVRSTGSSIAARPCSRPAMSSGTRRSSGTASPT